MSDILSLVGREGETEGEPPYRIEFCSQGLDVVRVAESAIESGGPFTHALLDMRMPPGIDGLETARRLREKDPRINIIFVSAYTEYENEQIRETLPDGYRMIRKPFTDQQILALFE